MSVKLRQLPIAPDLPMMQTPLSTEQRRYLAKIDGRRYSVLISRDDIARNGMPDPRWHVSVAGEDSVPPWNHFAAIVHELRPGVSFCVPMPPRSQWINVHEHVLHVWEIRDPALARQWASEGGGDDPS